MISKIRHTLGGFISTAKARWALRRIVECRVEIPQNRFGRERWKESLVDPSDFYRDCVISFHRHTPRVLKDHRTYFSQNNRGFGEDAFHVMWWMLFRELRPQRFLEIGVYRGQTLSYAALLHRFFAISESSVTGISPFLPAGDSVSEYSSTVDYWADTLSNFRHFSLPVPNLVRAYSTDQEATSVIQSGLWDVVYIDGNHDYEVALSDWRVCSAQVPPGGVVVLDDAGLSTSYRPPAFATGGHPGPSRLAAEISGDFVEILQVGHNRVFQRSP